MSSPSSHVWTPSIVSTVFFTDSFQVFPSASTNDFFVRALTCRHPSFAHGHHRRQASLLPLCSTTQKQLHLPAKQMGLNPAGHLKEEEEEEEERVEVERKGRLLDAVEGKLLYVNRLGDDEKDPPPVLTAVLPRGEERRAPPLLPLEDP
mmetsp:Transcript_53317/g.104286  ORF Transcript_53317/g.104286 Transcript_53317/m.104286 type:complete len:149 (+) Transcript_53317:767-1213(+)